MGLNKNHESEDFNGVKCAVVEKGVSKERAEFLKQLLEFNQYRVEVVASAPPKEKVAVAVAVEKEKVAVPVAVTNENSSEKSIAVPNAENLNLATPTPISAAATATAAPLNPESEPQSSTYNIGVTNLMFNSINAIYGRLLKTPAGHVVTMAFWQQKDNFSDDQVPYYEHK